MAATRSPGFIRSGGVSVNRSWVRSAPDEKTGPLPVITATLTVLSSSTSRTASTIALRKPRSIALRLCGRLSRNQAIPTSSTSTSSPRSAHDSTSRAIICLPFVRFDHLASSGPPTVGAAALLAIARGRGMWLHSCPRTAHRFDPVVAAASSLVEGAVQSGHLAGLRASNSG